MDPVSTIYLNSSSLLLTSIGLRLRENRILTKPEFDIFTYFGRQYSVMGPLNLNLFVSSRSSGDNVNSSSISCYSRVIMPPVIPPMFKFEFP